MFETVFFFVLKNVSDLRPLTIVQYNIYNIMLLLYFIVQNQCVIIRGLHAFKSKFAA